MSLSSTAMSPGSPASEVRAEVNREEEEEEEEEAGEEDGMTVERGRASESLLGHQTKQFYISLSQQVRDERP